MDHSKMSVMLTCKDMHAAAKFYKACGFTMKESWPDEKNPQWANLVLDGQSIMIGAAMEPDQVGEACHGDAAAEKYWKKAAEAFRKNQPGVGIQVYVMVPDIDAYAKEIRKKGISFEGEPKTQFYGIREICVDDPTGYRLIFFTPVAMTSCQSCGMPLTDAEPGQMYCSYCTDDKGTLHPYERILEGTVTGYFMAMQKMSRPDAEQAAKDHLAKMPAWAGRA